MALKDLSHAAERKAFSVAIDKFLKNVSKKDVSERTETYIKLINVAAKFWGDDASSEKFEAVKKAVSDPDNRWVKFINRVIDETNPHYAHMMLLNLGDRKSVV